MPTLQLCPARANDIAQRRRPHPASGPRRRIRPHGEQRGQHAEVPPAILVAAAFELRRRRHVLGHVLGEPFDFGFDRFGVDQLRPAVAGWPPRGVRAGCVRRRCRRRRRRLPSRNRAACRRASSAHRERTRPARRPTISAAGRASAAGSAPWHDQAVAARSSDATTSAHAMLANRSIQRDSPLRADPIRSAHYRRTGRMRSKQSHASRRSG